MGKASEKAKSSWLKKALSIAPSVLVFALVLTAFAISFVFEEFTYRAISIMFVLIAVECFIVRVFSLEQIKERLKTMGTLKSAGANHVELKCRKDLKAEMKNMEYIVEEAKEEVFLSSINFLSAGDIITALSKRSDLKIRLLVPNLDDPKVLEAYEAIRGRDLIGASVDNIFSNLCKYEHIEIRMINAVTTTLFWARDMKGIGGYIKAEHLLNSDDNDDLPSIELVPSNENWYGIYNKQIETLWSRAVPWPGN